MNKIFSVFHKAFFIPKDTIYQPIGVGGFDAFLPFEDNQGTNIADLNPYFCEMTAVYWIWKNYQQDPSDIVGLMHYRRYFKSIKRHISFSQRLMNKMQSFFMNRQKTRAFNYQFNRDINIASHNEVIEKIKLYEILLLSPYDTNDWGANTVENHYLQSHKAEDWQLIKQILTVFAPDYLQTFEKVANDHKLSFCNMFVCRRSFFDKYCEWLFPILFEFHNKTNYTEDVFQNRSVGYIAERLLNVYVAHNLDRAEIGYFDCYYIDN